MKNTLLEKKLKSNTQGIKPESVEFLDLQNKKHRQKALDLFKQKLILRVVDNYTEQLRELFGINNPELVYSGRFEKLFLEFLGTLLQKNPLHMQGNWAYFPWNGNLVHILPDADFQKVRTARNRHLITDEEQKKFYNSTIGIGGLSVGNSVILAIVLQGGAKNIKLADFDSLSLTNLNRIRGSITHMGLNKTVMTARQIYEINPYAHIEFFTEGLTEKNLDKFFGGRHPIDIVIDELDNIAIKFLVRKYAKKYHVPLLMGADNGDNAVVDIERYDGKKKVKFFHGRLGETSYQQLQNLDKFGIGKTITRHIGPENIGKRMQDSLLDMGKGIVSWPQLGGAALLNGSAVAFCARKILNGQPLEHNRAIVSLDELFIPSYNSPVNKKERKKIADNFKKMFGLK